MEKSRVELPDKIVKSHAYLISGAFGCHGIGMPVFRIEKSHIRSLQDQEPVGFRDHERNIPTLTKLRQCRDNFISFARCTSPEAYACLLS